MVQYCLLSTRAYSRSFPPASSLITLLDADTKATVFLAGVSRWLWSAAYPFTDSLIQSKGTTMTLSHHQRLFPLLVVATFSVEGFTNVHSPSGPSSATATNNENTNVCIPSFSSRLFASSNNNKLDGGDDNEAWDANVDYDAEWPQGSNKDGSSSSSSSSSVPDPSTAWDALPNMPADLNAERLGIDLQLEPLTPEQAEQLQEDASQVISDAIDAGIRDIERLRTRMNREIESSKRAMQLASDLEAKQQQEQLMNKIDKLTNNFLSSNEQDRKSTQLAAAANRAMEGSGRGLEMGTWGVLNGRTVIAGETAGASSSLLGSVVSAVQKQDRQQLSSSENGEAVVQQQQQNRILVIADTKQVRRTVVHILSHREETLTRVFYFHCRIHWQSNSSQHC